MQYFKFYYSLNNVGRDPPQEYPWILGEQIWCVLAEMSFDTFTLIWSHVSIWNLYSHINPMLAKMKKKNIGKNPKFEIS